jgi:hypothetical protein
MRPYHRDSAMDERVTLARENDWSWKAIVNLVGISRTKIHEIIAAEHYTNEPERVIGEVIHTMIEYASEAFEEPRRFSIVIKGRTVARISLE